MGYNLKPRDNVQTAFHSCSACCFSTLQTDAPSNLFILGWAMGVTHCHFVASIQRHPMYKLSFTVMAFTSMCNVYVPACSWTYASSFFFLSFFLKHMYLQLFESLLQIQPASMCVCLFPSGLYPKMTVLQNINLIWSLLWPRLYLSKLPLIELLFSQPLGSCYQGGLCLSVPISLGDWVDVGC